MKSNFSNWSLEAQRPLKVEIHRSTVSTDNFSQSPSLGNKILNIYLIFSVLLRLNRFQWWRCWWLVEIQYKLNLKVLNQHSWGWRDQFQKSFRCTNNQHRTLEERECQLVKWKWYKDPIPIHLHICPEIPMFVSQLFLASVSALRVGFLLKHTE